MAKKFLGFTADQQHKLLSKLGYAGPVDPKMMEAFVEATPAVANKMGNYQRLAQEKLNTPNLKLEKGGVVAAPVEPVLTQAEIDAANTANVTAGANLTPEAVKGNLDTAQATLAAAQKAATETPSAANTAALTKAQTALQTAQSSFNTVGVPSASELISSALNDPSSLIPATKVEKVATSPDQTIQAGTGQMAGTVPVSATTVPTAAQAAAPTATGVSTVGAVGVADKSAEELAKTQAAVGTVGAESQVQAAQGTVSPGSLAEASTFDPNYIKLVDAGSLAVTPDQMVAAQGQDAIAPSAQIAQSAGIDPAVAVQGTVSANELPEAAQIKESEIAQAQAVSSSGQLNQNATAVAAKMASFTVDNGTLAAAIQGNVNAQDTVQGQLSNLMQQFNDGTPAWAAGAIRAANGAMAARGLGGSSIAGAAILQAAMESALPIATQDAQVFNNMNLTNLDNRQKVALSNAAAQQGLSLTNLSNEQQAALQNSANAFSLQSQDLSNMQQTVLANAQIKAALQGQNLSNQQQANLAVAARFAEVSNMNLNNRQQTALTNNANSLQIELSNLSNRQQAYIANAQLSASLQGKQVDNQQQAAVLNASRISEAANITFSAEQQEALHNSTLMQTVGATNLSAKQAATLQNAATMANMDTTNLNNRQQAAVQNAAAFLQMDLTNLSNEQQTSIFKAQTTQQALLSDQAAQNAALQFNASSQNQTDQFFAGLQESVSRFNADQTNSVAQFNAGAENATAEFNAKLKNEQDQFNANNSLVIAQANAKWRQDVSLADTAAQNEANMNDAKNATGLTTAAMDGLLQRERDLMSFAFTSSESALDRKLQLMVADKTIEIAKLEERGLEKQGIGYLVGNIFGDLF